MKKISSYLAALAVTLGLGSCADNWVTPPIDVPTEGADIEATLTIAELKATYWQDANSYGTPVTALPDGRHAIIKGTVVSSTASGNIYKAVYIQDSTAAICIGIDTTNVNTVLPMGVGVAIDVTGLQIGRYSGAMQLGKADGSSVNRITYKELKPHVALDFWSGRLDTTEVSLAYLRSIANQEGIREWGGKLVRINGVQFQEAGQAYAPGATTSRHIQDSIGNSIIVYNSSYADFAYDLLPYGTGDVVGILSNYNMQWQLLLIDADGVIGFDGEGSPDDDKEAPDLPEGVLTVQQALDIIASGNIPAEPQQVMGRIVSIDNIDTSYGNATYTIMDKGGTKGLIVYRGYWLNGNKFTSENQLKVGEYIIVEGVLVNYNGSTPEITSGSKVIAYYGDTEGGDTPPTDTPAVPTGVVTVAQALDYIAKGGQANDAAIQVKGIISKIDDIDTGSYGNATYYIKDNLNDANALEVYRGYGLDGAKFTSANQLEVGAEVIVEGKPVNYNGTYELTSGSKIISYNGQTSGGGNTGGSTPETPTGVITVAQALAYITSGNIPADEVQVKGVITAIDEVSTQYGNATFTIKDNASDANGLIIFRSYWLDGEKYTSASQIAVGAEVIVQGKLVNYNGTPEMTTGGRMISYNGQTSGGGNTGGNTPTEPDTPTEPGTPGTVVFDFTKPASLTPAYPATAGSQPDNGNTYEAVSNVKFTNNGVTVSATKGNSTDARIYYQSSGAIQYRIYNGASLTVSSSLPIKTIEFDFNNASTTLTSGGQNYTKSNPTVNASGATSMTFTTSATAQINKITVVTE